MQEARYICCSAGRSLRFDRGDSSYQNKTGQWTCSPPRGQVAGNLLGVPGNSFYKVFYLGDATIVQPESVGVAKVLQSNVLGNYQIDRQETLLLRR